jgi:AcrR family transcriptional regulator
MPRVVKEESYAQRRNEIIDAAQRLVYTKGYEQMSIQDILELTGMSKGAFYHYFDSKPALLEALIDRMVQESEKVISPIVYDPNLSALEKLHEFFHTAARWKSSQKDYMLAILRVWYADENAIVRDKVLAKQLGWAASWLAHIFRQGMAEGVMDVPYPDQTALAAMTLLTGLSNGFARLILSPPKDGSALTQAEQLIFAYNRLLERAVGAPQGSLSIMDEATAREWIDIEPQV